MYVKKLRRKCGVRGCKNIETYSISLSREAGNTVIICKSCLGKALGAIDEVAPQADVRVSPTEAPPLFFNGAMASMIKKEVEPAEPEDIPENEDVITEEEPELAPVEQMKPLEVGTEETPQTEAEVLVTEQPEGFVCPHCGQVCKSEQGLQAHIRNKHKGEA